MRYEKAQLGCEHFQTKINDLPYMLLPILDKRNDLLNKNKDVSDKPSPLPQKNNDLSGWL